MGVKRPADEADPTAAAVSGTQEDTGKRTRASSCDDMETDGNEANDALKFASLHAAFDALASEFPDRLAAEDDLGASWSYAKLQAASLVAAAGMAGHKQAHAGDRCTAWPAPVALLMRRSCAWVATTIGAMRIGVPSLSLSGDLRNAEETQRNRDSLVEHMPFLLVLDSALRAISPVQDGALSPSMQVVDSTQLLEGNNVPNDSSFAPHSSHLDDALYIVYTGGTTSASKSVVVTHRMALHELNVYPKIAPMECTDRVLHQTSAYWGATSLGIFDVAWACGGCLVLTEAGAGPGEVASIVRRREISTIGVVPSVLEALEPGDCSTLRVIFTWGEALAASTAARWAAHAVLLDLLIASEYWLILVSSYRANGVQRAANGFRPVPGARLTLLSPQRDDTASSSAPEAVQDGNVGELYIAGPMVSAIGYTNPVKNHDAFVDLPVGIGGSLVRHFRTRDLARRCPNGSLEYCGRADGFAKVGGKWLDLASVERRLLEHGCNQAALVWDEQGKRRHAAVVLEKDTLNRRSIAQCAAELQRLLPKDTNLHLRKSLPQNPATGKIHRGRLVEELAALEEAARIHPSEGAASVRKFGRALAVGLLLAGRAGARGAVTLSLAFRFAPGISQHPMRVDSRGDCTHGPAIASLPSGVSHNMAQWAVWHCAAGKCLSLECMRILPYIFLLLIDGQATGLKTLATVFETGPLGLAGAAILLSSCTKPWVRQLLLAAGVRQARRARGGAGWSWAFWIGFPYFASCWEHDCSWFQTRRREIPHRVAEDYLRAFRSTLLEDNGSRVSKLPSLARCNTCLAFSTDGVMWGKKFYCSKCQSEWSEVQTDDVQMQEESWQWKSSWGREEPKAGVSQVDFTDEDIQQARSRIPDRGSHKTAANSNSGATTPVGRIVEKCSGIDASSPAASLSSIESLKLIAVVSAIRRELGLPLAAGDVARCTCLGDLEALCAEAQTKISQQQGNPNKESDDGSGTWAIMAIPRFFSAPVGSFIRLDAIPSARAMHAAACALVRRHPGLRAQEYGNGGDEALAEMFNNAAPMVVVLNQILQGSAKGFAMRISDAVCASWPRIRVLPATSGAITLDSGPEVAHFQYCRFKTRDELENAAFLRKRSRGFKVPANIGLLILSENENSAESENADSGDEAYLHIAVNHAVSDAFCIVPLVADLLALHDAACQIERSGKSFANIGDLADKALEVAALPHARNGLALQEARAQSALRPVITAPDAQDMCENIFNPRRGGYDHYVRLNNSAINIIEAGGAVIGVPIDHLLVCAIAIAFARMTGDVVVKLTLIVPMRDGEGEGHVIANFANSRHFRLPVGERSFQAVALDLSQRLRRRDWELSDATSSGGGNKLFVNVRDIPIFEGARAIVEDIDTSKNTTHHVKNAMEMFVDKTTKNSMEKDAPASWGIIIGIRDDLDGWEFGKLLKQVLWNAAVEPLGPALPVLPLGADDDHLESAEVACTRTPAEIDDAVRRLKAATGRYDA